MNRRLAATALVGAWSVGLWVGHQGDPQTTTVKFPTTHTVQTKTVTHTVTVHTPLQQACLDLIDTLNQEQAFAAVVTEVTGKHIDNMSDAQIAMGEHRFLRLNTLTQKERGYKDKTDTAQVSLLQAQDLAKTQLQACKSSTDNRS